MDVLTGQTCSSYHQNKQDGEEDLQMWKVTAYELNEQSRVDERRWLSSLVVGRPQGGGGLVVRASHRKELSC
jgi:hypothetical protein